MIINLASFYALWWSTALMANKGLDLFIALILVATLSVHYFIHKKSWKNETKTIFLIALLGCVFDIALHYFNFFELKGNYLFWLSIVWIGFGLTINHSMKKVFSNNLLLFILALIGGPLSYYSASKFGLLNYPFNLQHLVLHGLMWGLFSIALKKILKMARLH